MYHNDAQHTIEVPDGVDLSKATAKIVMVNDVPMLLLEAPLVQEKVNEVMRLHLTNGVNHHYLPLERHEDEPAPAKKGKK